MSFSRSGLHVTNVGCQPQHPEQAGPFSGRDFWVAENLATWRAACAYVTQFAPEIEALADELLMEQQLKGFALTRTIERAENQDRRNYDNA